MIRRDQDILEQSALRPAPRSEAREYVGSGKLRHLVAIVTGGGSGIGRAASLLFAREGADVAITYLPVEQPDAEVTAELVELEGQSCLMIPGDLQDPAFCDDVVRETVQKFERLDILVNNAAYQQRRKYIGDIDDEQWDRTFRTNIYAYFYMARAAVAYLRRGASIVNVGSITGVEGSEHLLDYSATKGAIHAFTKALARNLLGKGIRVNAVAPGPASTQAQDIAPAIVFLASRDSCYITGEVLGLQGGETTA